MHLKTRTWKLELENLNLKTWTSRLELVNLNFKTWTSKKNFFCTQFNFRLENSSYEIGHQWTARTKLVLLAEPPLLFRAFLRPAGIRTQWFRDEPEAQWFSFKFFSSFFSNFFSSFFSKLFQVSSKISFQISFQIVFQNSFLFFSISFRRCQFF